MKQTKGMIRRDKIRDRDREQGKRVGCKGASFAYLSLTPFFRYDGGEIGARTQRQTSSKLSNSPFLCCSPSPPFPLPIMKWERREKSAQKEEEKNNGEIKKEKVAHGGVRIMTRGDRRYHMRSVLGVAHYRASNLY